MSAPDTPRILTEPPSSASHGAHDFGFEERDTRVSTLVKVMVVSIIIIAGSITGLFIIIGRLNRADEGHPPLTRQQSATIIPPGPHLQDDPLRDIMQERERENTLLTTYGWVDKAHTQARIPIERAIALVVGKPLDPVR